MKLRPLDCFDDAPIAGALPIHVCGPAGLATTLSGLMPAQRAYLQACHFSAKQGECILLPGESGISAAILGRGEATGPNVYSVLPGFLPAGTHWYLPAEQDDVANAVLGWALGSYKFERFQRKASLTGAHLFVSDAQNMTDVLSVAEATWMVRDLINMPANLLGPQQLAHFAADLLRQLDADVNLITNSLLQDSYPVIHAVGAGSEQAPAVVLARWAGPGAGPDAPLFSLCGKGVCFDTGGYDVKSAAGMLRMKKDMGGAAIALGVAYLIIKAALPVRLELRLGCVENMISGGAMRPLDIVMSRTGMAIEIGNTDAEGRLVLSDLLAEACENKPDILVDFATLTGAARVALGPDIPALFCNDDVLADELLKFGNQLHDPLWRLPLWHGYNSWLESSVADLNNVSEKSHAGAILAALFLQRFVCGETKWAHIDVYAWNDAARFGSPAGGEAQSMRTVFETLRKRALRHIS